MSFGPFQAAPRFFMDFNSLPETVRTLPQEPYEHMTHKILVQPEEPVFIGSNRIRPTFCTIHGHEVGLTSTKLHLRG